MKVNRYQFDSVVSKTKQGINPILRGEENGIYFEYLAMIELQMYDFHLEYNINGRQAAEILQLVLYDIKGIAENEEYDCTKWEEECYRSCADTIESLFMPEKNPELQADLKKPTVLNDDYFELSRKVIVRIYESVGLWTKKLGPDGYFSFIGQYVGTEIWTSKKYLVENRFLNQ